MTQRLKYKVISYSSEEKQYPVTSLLVPGSDGWQTKRFCNYPQEVTLEFYGVVHVQKIEILADSRKIASTVDILYYDPNQSATDSRFSKYGSLEFTKNQSGRIHQQKTVMVDMKCLYIRFLFHRPYKNKQNFFSQVHVHQLAVYGGQTNGSILPLETSLGKKSSAINLDAKAIAEEDDQFVYEKLMEIQKRKDQAVGIEDYDQADRMKQIMVNVKKFGYKLKALKDKKNQAAENEDYQLAKTLKEQIDRLKKEVSVLVNQTLEGQMDDQQQQNHPQMQHDVQGNQFVGLQINKLMERQDQSYSRVSQKKSRVNNNNSSASNKKTDRNYLENSYDERIVPAAIKNNALKTQQSQIQPEEFKQELGPAEKIDGNNAGDASVMMEFFQEETVRQFFSKQWQHKEKALTDIPIQAAKKEQDPQLIKCLLRAVSQSLNQTNFKLAQLSLSLLREVLKMNAKFSKLNKTNVDNRDLQNILEEIIRKISDNNAKIRTTSEHCFQEMLESTLFGVQVCCSSLIKPSIGKGSVKQEIQKLASLALITTKYGLGPNGAPTSVIDFGVQKLSNPSGDVRNEAIHLLATCANKQYEQVASKLQGKKSTYLQQIEARQQQLLKKSVKK